MTAKPLSVSLRRYHDPARLLALTPDWRSAPELLAPLLPELEQLARQALDGADGTVRAGRVLATPSAGASVGVFVERGPRLGAALVCRWRPGADACSVTVGPLSRVQGTLQGVLLAVGVVLGVLLSRAALAPHLAALPALLLGGLLGLVLGVLLILGAIRAGVGIDRAGSAALSGRLAREVEGWVAHAP